MKSFEKQIQNCIHQDFSKNGEDVLTYLHGLPDQSWPEPEPEDPLSEIDQVGFYVFWKIMILHFLKVELAMAYNCSVR